MDLVEIATAIATIGAALGIPTVCRALWVRLFADDKGYVTLLVSAIIQFLQRLGEKVEDHDKLLGKLGSVNDEQLEKIVSLHDLTSKVKLSQDDLLQSAERSEAMLKFFTDVSIEIAEGWQDDDTIKAKVIQSLRNNRELISQHENNKRK